MYIYIYIHVYVCIRVCGSVFVYKAVDFNTLNCHLIEC